METRLFINGEYVEATSGHTWENICPATEEVICVVREASVEDVDKAVKAAHAALPHWSIGIGASERGRYMLKLADALEGNLEEMAKLESLDVGKPLKVCREIDILHAAATLRYYAGWADKIYGHTIPSNKFDSLVTVTRKEAVGVVAAILPWNFPMVTFMNKVAAALACGCTIIAKSSEKTPLSMAAFGKIAMEAGLPKGVLNILCGFGPSVGEALVKHPLVNKVSFTGSTAVGRKVAQECAMSMKRVTLECGGKSALLVLGDADMNVAVASAWEGLFVNSGQCCIACSRILVHSSIHDKFVEELKKYSEKRAVLLPPSDPKCTQGPIVDKIQFDKVCGYIQAGIKEGATCALGGKPKGGKGFWVLPTIFTNVKDEMKIAQEEIFGPIDRANSSQYGLGGGVITNSVGDAEYVASRLKAGTIWINTYFDMGVGAPFGGFKNSGIGREDGYEGLLPYLEVKTVRTNISHRKNK